MTLSTERLANRVDKGAAGGRRTRACGANVFEILRAGPFAPQAFKYCRRRVLLAIRFPITLPQSLNLQYRMLCVYDRNAPPTAVQNGQLPRDARNNPSQGA